MRYLGGAIVLLCVLSVSATTDEKKKEVKEDRDPRLGFFPTVIDLGGTGSSSATIGTTTSTSTNLVSTLFSAPILLLAFGLLGLYFLAPFVSVSFRRKDPQTTDYYDKLSNTNTYSTYDNTYSNTYSRALQDQGDFILKAIKSIDPVDTAFNFLDIDSKDCRKRAICELEAKLKTSPLSGFAMKYASHYFPGINKYRDAVNFGVHSQDCSFRYSGCPHSIIDLLFKWKRH